MHLVLIEIPFSPPWQVTVAVRILAIVGISRMDQSDWQDHDRRKGEQYHQLWARCSSARCASKALVRSVPHRLRGAYKSKLCSAPVAHQVHVSTLISTLPWAVRSVKMDLNPHVALQFTSLSFGKTFGA